MKTIFYFSSNIPRKKLPNVVNEVMDIVEKHNPETLGVKPFFTILSEQQQQLEAYTEPRISHPLSSVIITDRKQVMDLIQSIQLVSKSVEKANLPVNAEAAAKVLPLIKMHLMKVGQHFTTAAEKQTNSFLVALAENVTVNEAAATIGIGKLTNELKLTFVKLKSNVKLRLADKAARRMVKDSKLEEAIIKAITNLLKAIELAKVQHPTVDYSVVISELNELFISYRTQYRSKKTRNANALIKKETAATSTTTTATVN